MGIFDKESPLNNFIKIGEVSSVDYAKGTARVVFDDEDSLVSYDLPVRQINTIANKDYAMPDVGEDALCVFLPSGEEEGFIIGSWYAGAVAPPSGFSKDKRLTVFSDGSSFYYDRAAHEFKAQIGDTKITIDRIGVEVDAPKNVVVNSGQSVTVKGGQNVVVEGGSNVIVKGGSLIALNAPTVTLTMGNTTMNLNGSSAEIVASNLTFKGTMKVEGNMSVSGNINSTGNIVASGIVDGSNIH